MKVVAFANKENIYLDNLVNSLNKYRYDFEIIGEGVKWKNFMTKVFHCKKYIEKLPENTIVAVIDAFDVLACDISELLLIKFKKFHKRIVFGCENNCVSGICTPLDRYFEYHSDVKKGRYTYVNGGFYIGYRESLLHMYEYILGTRLTDDQLAMGKYINKYPEHIGLDMTGNLVSNIQIYSYFDTVWKGKPYNRKTRKSSCFIHTPGMFFDLTYRMDYFGSRILKSEYKTLTLYDKLYNHSPRVFYKIMIVSIILIIFFIACYKLYYE